MTVRLLRPQFGQAVNTIYTSTQAAEDTLKATGNADDRIELATDYQTYLFTQNASSTMPLGVDPTARLSLSNNLYSRFVYNDTPANTLLLSKKIAAARGGVASMKVAFIGDSKTAGQGAVPVGATTAAQAAREFSTPAQFARAIAARGLPVRTSNWFGDANVQNTGTANTFFDVYDPRFTAYRNGWVPDGNNVPGGHDLINSTTTNPLTFSPPETHDIIDVYTFRNSGLGSLNVSVDGGATIQTINGNGASALIKTSMTVARGMHSITLTPTAVAPVAIAAIDTRDSTTPQINVINMGACAWKAGVEWSQNTSPWTPIPGLGQMGIDVAFIELGTNDANNGTLAAFNTGLATLLARCAALNIFPILCVPDTWSGNASDAVQEQFKAAILAFAGTTIPVIDFKAYMGSYVTRIADPTDFYDTIHLNRSGYARKATLLADFWLSH